MTTPRTTPESGHEHEHGVDPDTVHALRVFRNENTSTALAGPAPVHGAPATIGELRDLLLFAAGHAQGDPTLPRTLKAHQLVWSVPEDVGAALFTHNA